MAHKNRWFTELKNGGSFHGYVSHNQMVGRMCQSQPSSTLSSNLMNLMAECGMGIVKPPSYHHFAYQNGHRKWGIPKKPSVFRQRNGLWAFGVCHPEVTWINNRPIHWNSTQLGMASSLLLKPLYI